jgi:hypothetical protein
MSAKVNPLAAIEICTKSSSSSILRRLSVLSRSQKYEERHSHLPTQSLCHQSNRQIQYMLFASTLLIDEMGQGENHALSL